MATSLTQALETAGLEMYAEIFQQADVDIEVFLFITDNDLTELGIKVGPRRKLLNLQKQLREMQGVRFDDDDDDDEFDDEEDDEEGGEEGSDASSSDEEITEEDNGPPVILKRPVDEEHEKAKEAKREDREKRRSMAKEVKAAAAGMANLTLAPLPATLPPSPAAAAAAAAASSASSPAPQKPPAAANVPAAAKGLPTSTSNTNLAAQTPPSPVSSEYIKNKDKSSKMIKLETVPDICADEIEGADCQGWLWKQGGMVKSWKKRWCVLKGPCLYYFPTPSKTKAKGMITLPSYEITTAAEQVNKEFAFQAYHPSARTYIFVANNKHDMQHWIKMMILATRLIAPLSAQTPGGVPVAVAGGVIIPNVPATSPTAPVKATNTPLPANAHVRFNIFDVRITRKQSEIIGLDIKVNRQNGTIVTKVHEGSPAANVGMIQVGDQIVKIDGKTIAGMTASMVVEIMRELKENFVFSIRRL